jgi:hypothetical protein
MSNAYLKVSHIRSANITGDVIAKLPVESHSSMRKEPVSYIASSFAVLMSSS